MRLNSSKGFLENQDGGSRSWDRGSIEDWVSWKIGWRIKDLGSRIRLRAWGVYFLDLKFQIDKAVFIAVTETFINKNNTNKKNTKSGKQLHVCTELNSNNPIVMETP